MKAIRARRLTHPTSQENTSAVFRLPGFQRLRTNLMAILPQGMLVRSRRIGICFRRNAFSRGTASFVKRVWFGFGWHDRYSMLGTGVAFTDLTLTAQPH